MAKEQQDLLEEFRSFLAAVGQEPVPSFIAGLDWSMPERRLVPRSLPCLQYLPAAARTASAAGRRLAALLVAAADRFSWGQSYSEADLGLKFLASYGWLEVFGTRGHFENSAIAGGFLLLGPLTVYPDHHHEAEEVYVPLTGGTEWRIGSEPFRLREAGDVIHHGPNVSHAMRTTDDPLLALYLWRRGPLAARSTLAADNAALRRG